jgi:hypothetical protein
MEAEGKWGRGGGRGRESEQEGGGGWQIAMGNVRSQNLNLPIQSKLAHGPEIEYCRQLGHFERDDHHSLPSLNSNHSFPIKFLR